MRIFFYYEAYLRDKYNLFHYNFLNIHKSKVHYHYQTKKKCIGRNK